MSEDVLWVGKPAPDIRNVGRQKLAEWGYEVHLLANTGEALRWLERSRPKAAFVEIAQPELNGILACSELKMQAESLPVFAFNHGNPAMQQAAFAAGVDAVLDYPPDWAQVRACLQPGAQKPTGQRPPTNSALWGHSREDILNTTMLLAHDLKSPMSIVIGGLEVLLPMLEDDPNYDMALPVVAGALHAAYRQINLTSDSLDLTRLRLGDFPLIFAATDLRVVISDAVEEQEYHIANKNMDFTLDLPDEPLMAVVDAELIGRALTALVDNALKFTLKGGRLRINASMSGERIVINLIDDGRQVASDYAEVILQRGAGVETRKSGSRTSVALGLPFANAVAEAHGGSVTAASNADSGLTTFTVRLPLARENADG